MNSSTSSPPLAATNNQPPRPRVLLVEDNEMGRQMVRTMLEHLQVQVIEAVNGADALAKAAVDNFALVLMDIQMPVMDGIAAATAIRLLEQPNANTPIIAMTAYIVEEVEQQFAQAGFNSCISKPIELNTLCTQLQLWLPDLPAPYANENVPLDNHTFLQKAMPHIDVVAALNRISGNCKLYRNLLKKFNNQFAHSASQLQQEIEEKNFPAARFIVHNLKGAAASLGAIDLQHCADDLERQLANEQQPVALTCTLAELEQFIQLIQELPADSDPVQDTHTNKQLGSSAELHALLAELRVPLHRLQIKHVRQALAQLEQKQWPELFSAQLQQLVDLVDNYQFSPAGELLEVLLAASAE